MAAMAKKKPKTDQPTPEPGRTPLRVDDKRLFDSLDAYARRLRRSRNMAIQLLLEEAMTREGLWPPPTVG